MSLFAARKIKGSQHSEMCILGLLKTCSLKSVSVWKWANTLGILQKNFILTSKLKLVGAKKDSNPSLWVIH